MPEPQYVVQWNCRGLTTKVGELRERLHLGKLGAEAFLLQETSFYKSRSYAPYRYLSIPLNSAAVYLTSQIDIYNRVYELVKYFDR